MKKAFAIILFLLVNFYLQAQDWAPVREGEVYHYYTETQPFQSISFDSINFVLLPNDLVVSSNQNAVKNTFSIGVDSAISNPQGAIDYYYAPRTEPCDTCIAPTLNKITTTDSTYLFPKVILKASGSYLLIIHADTIELAANPITTSIVNTSQQFTVQVDSIYWATLFDNIPSITTVQDSMIILKVESSVAPYPILYEVYLSKNYGIVELVQYNVQSQLPSFSFRLIGKEGAINGGFTRLKFQDIFDYNVGDQFFYYVYEFDGTGIWWFPNREHKYRLRVLSRQDVSPDTIIYTMDKIIHWGWNIPWAMNVLDTITKTYIFSETEFYNLQEGELGLQGGTRHVACKDFLMKDRKFVGYDYELTTQAGNYISWFYPTGVPNQYQGVAGAGIEAFALLYEKGLGEVYRGEWYFESTLRRKLDGYIKGTDTVGIIPLILSPIVIKKPTVTELKLLSNPVEDYLSVYYKSSSPSKKLVFSILNMQGLRIQSYNKTDCTDNTFVFPVNGFSSGMYILEIRQEGALIAVEQFIKK